MSRKYRKTIVEITELVVFIVIHHASTKIVPACILAVQV